MYCDMPTHDELEFQASLLNNNSKKKRKKHLIFPFAMPNSLIDT